MNFSQNCDMRKADETAREEYKVIMANGSRQNSAPLHQLCAIRKAMHIADTYPLKRCSRGQPAASASSLIHEMAGKITNDPSQIVNRDLSDLHRNFCSGHTMPLTDGEIAAIHTDFQRQRLLALATRLWQQHLASADPRGLVKHDAQAQTDPRCIGALESATEEERRCAISKYPSLKKVLKPQVASHAHNSTPQAAPTQMPWNRPTLGGINMNNAPTPKNSESGFVTATDQFNMDLKSGKIPPGRHVTGLKRTPVPANQPSVDQVLSATHNAQAKKTDEDGDEHLIPPSLLLPDGSLDPRLEGLEPKLLAQVAMEILDSKGNRTEWSDIAGLQHAKDSVEEAIVWPLLNPDLFTGLRDPPRGLLLFGPPGTGKTMIARAIASRAGCTFMNISASSLMSKWVGEGEKLVRCMFAVACVKQPTVVFIDEIDSLLSMRSEGEMDAVRRVKTEFLVQMDGVGTDRNDRVLLIGATNRPEELDEAARRRMEKRLYIPLPDSVSRTELIRRLIGTHSHSLTDTDFTKLGDDTEGYSGADVKGFAREAAMGPVRSLKKNAANTNSGGISTANAHDVRPVSMRDCLSALKRIKPSVGSAELLRYEKWNDQYGSFPMHGSPVDDDDEDE